MAIPYQFYEGEFDKMGNITPKAGNILICKDTRQVYIDLYLTEDAKAREEATRICLGSIDVNNKEMPLSEYVKSMFEGIGLNDDNSLKSVKDYIDDEAVKKSGDTMTGNLNVDAASASIVLKDTTKDKIGKILEAANALILQSWNSSDLANTKERRQLNLRNQAAHSSISDALILYDVDAAGTATPYKIYGEHNITATTTELNYVDGVTSNIQTQINGKAPTSHASTTTTYGESSASNYGHAMASSTIPKENGTAAVGSETAKFARGDHVHPLQVNVSGNAGTATKLQTARNIQVKLNSTSAASFNGESNITPGVTGTLLIANGGTGKTTAAEALAALGGVKKAGDTMTGALSITINGGGSTSSINPYSSQTVIRNKISAESWQDLYIGANGLQYYKNTTPYQIYGQHNVTVAASSDDETKAGETALANGHIHLVYE